MKTVDYKMLAPNMRKSFRNKHMHSQRLALLPTQINSKDDSLPTLAPKNGKAQSERAVGENWPLQSL